MLSARAPQSNLGNKRISIITSFYPLSYVVNAVGGNLVEVYNLTPAGSESHDFEPTARDFVKIGSADVLLYNGASFEVWVEKWWRSTTMQPGYVVDMAEKLKEYKGSLIYKNGVVDPHFWLSPVVMKHEAEIVQKILSEIDPAHADFFSDNTKRFQSSMDLLDKHFQEKLSSCRLRDVVVLHEAFDYMGRQYGFSVTSIAGISPEEEPSPKELSRIISIVREKGVRYIFSETIASPKFSELIARETNGGTLVLNPIESLTPDEVQWGEDYVSLMEKNIDNLQKAMECN